MQMLFVGAFANLSDCVDRLKVGEVLLGYLKSTPCQAIVEASFRFNTGYEISKKDDLEKDIVVFVQPALEAAQRL